MGDRLSHNRIHGSAAAFLIGAASAAAYFGLVYRYAVNVPNADDFDIFIGFLLEFLDAGTDKMQLLFARHGEHYVVLNRAAALLAYYLSGSLNFRVMIFLGNLAVPLVCALLYAACRPHGVSRLMFLPVVLLIFAPHYPEASMWATAALEDLWVAPLMLASFVAWERLTGWKRWIGALLPAAAATFTQGNGVFAWAGLAVMSYKMQERGRAAIWLTAFLVFACLHLASLQQISTLRPSTWQFISHVFSFLGSAPLPGFAPALVVGMLLAVFTAFAFFRKQGSAAPALVALACTSVLTAGANALARASYGVGYPVTQSRYHFPSIVFFAGCYLLACVFRPALRRIALPISLLAAIFYLYAFTLNLPEYQLRRDRLRESLLRQRIGGTGLEHPDPAHAARLLGRLMARKAYTPPPVAEAELLASKAAPFDFEAGRLTGRFEHVLQGEGYLLISGYGFQRSGRETDVFYLVFSQGSQRYFFQAHARPRPDAVRHHKFRAPLQSGFAAMILRDALPPGVYLLQLIVRDPGGSARAGLRRVVTLH